MCEKSEERKIQSHAATLLVLMFTNFHAMAFARMLSRSLGSATVAAAERKSWLEVWAAGRSVVLSTSRVKYGGVKYGGSYCVKSLAL